jgi:predicted DNA-binding helix-hairpin-helix protein
VDVNRADRETLLRVPGLGVRNVERLLELRALKTLRYTDLVRLRVPMKRVAPFIVTVDHRPRGDVESATLRPSLRSGAQGDLFGS